MPHDDESPVFQKPRQPQTAGDSDHGDTYYQHRPRILKKWIDSKGGVKGTTLTERAEAWRRGCLNTPYGQSNDLKVGLNGPGTV
jgi:hypothetical protein